MTAQSRRPVVVTRPRAQAEPLARRVAALGREAVVFPLLDIHPLPDQQALSDVLRNVVAYALVAFVSPNAIDAAFAILGSWPRQVAIGVMGEGSRAALARHILEQAQAALAASIAAQPTTAG